MKTINWKTFTMGLACGLVLGFGMRYLFEPRRATGETAQVYRFERAGPGGKIMMRFDTRTGKAWKTKFPQEGGWNGAWYWEEVADPAK